MTAAGQFLFTFFMFSMMSMLWSNAINHVQNYRTESDDRGMLGRPVQIPARDYVLAFKVEAPKLGDCALRIEDGRIITCTAKFAGNEIFIPRASTNVDVSRVQNSADVITQGMGGIGVSVGVLGLASVGLKGNVAVTTQTSNKHLTIMNSYDLQRGTVTLQNPHPLTDVSEDGELYLSEIEIGGNEILAVTMEFESTQKKIEVEATLTFKILFISISAKLRYVRETFKSASKTRIQFKSSWRPHIDSTYTSLEDAIVEVERIEKMYAAGPEELAKLDIKDPKGHNTYYFSAWNKSPFGEKANMATIHNDLSILSQQNLETQSVLNRISELSKVIFDLEKVSEMKELNSTVNSIHTKLDKGIEVYHKLSNSERTELRDIYGQNKAPEYYTRQLKRIVGY